MSAKSKIICTIGPASQENKILESLLNNGADVFRFNLKYNTPDWHRETMAKARKAADKIGRELSIMVDLPNINLAGMIKGADLTAVSYIKTGSEVKKAKNILKKAGGNGIIIAKVENGQALSNISEIIEESDGIMVARGDLGREIPVEQLAFWQKEIINVCRLAAKPVIVATEMLLSMKDNPSPTRAEATDVANAVFDGTDALMLSEETAIGKYPEEAMKYMARITRFCDQKNNPKPIKMNPDQPSEVLVEAAISMTKKPGIKIKALVVFSQSGQTVRRTASYRPGVPIIAITNNEKILKLLGLSRGVIPHYLRFDQNKFQKEDPVFQGLKEYRFLNTGDMVLVIHGSNWIREGSTSDISLMQL